MPKKEPVNTSHKALSDKELMDILKIDSKTLARFRQIREETIKEARQLCDNAAKRKIKVLGISGSARDEFDMAQEASNSEELLKACLDDCKKLGADTELIQLRKFNIQHCKACYSTANTQCHFYCTCYPKGKPTGDDMTNKLYDKVLEADAIIFATPVNNFNISTLMKTFIDRCISLDGSLKPANPDSPKDKELNRKHMRFIELTSDNNIPGSGLLKRFMGKVGGLIVVGHEEGASMAISNLFLTLNCYGMIFPPYSLEYAMSSVSNSTYKDKDIVLTKYYRDSMDLLAKNMITCVKTTKGLKPTEWKYNYYEN